MLSINFKRIEHEINKNQKRNIATNVNLLEKKYLLKGGYLIYGMPQHDIAVSLSKDKNVFSVTYLESPLLKNLAVCKILSSEIMNKEKYWKRRVIKIEKSKGIVLEIDIDNLNSNDLDIILANQMQKLGGAMNKDKLRLVILKETENGLLNDLDENSFKQEDVGFDWETFVEQVNFLVSEGYITSPCYDDYDNIIGYSSSLTEKGEKHLKNNIWYKKGYNVIKEIADLVK